MKEIIFATLWWCGIFGLFIGGAALIYGSGF